MKGSVSSSQAMLVLFFSPPESPLLSGPPMTVSREVENKTGGQSSRTVHGYVSMYQMVIH